MVASTTWLCEYFIGSGLDFNIALWLALKVFLGAITYMAAYFVMWAMAGRPEGPENLLFRLVHRPASI